MKTHSSVTVGKYLLAKSKSINNRQLNVTQVQKLLYIAYGIGLKEHDTAIVDEKPSAWPFGPVFPKVKNQIDYGKLYDENDAEFATLREDNEACVIIDKTVTKYGHFPATKLSAWSHADGGPWAKTTSKAGFNWNDKIDDHLIRDYFSTLTI